MTGHVWVAGTTVPVDGRWFRVGVLNRSTAPISNVTVQLVAVDPPGVVRTVPLPSTSCTTTRPRGSPTRRRSRCSRATSRPSSWTWSQWA